jgi:peroxiredoxin
MLPSVLLHRLGVLLLALSLGGLPACGEGGSSSRAQAGSQAAAATADQLVQQVSTRRRERPLPAFQGRSLEGEQLSISSFIGKRLILLFFNPEVEQAKVVARAVANLASERGRHNFEVIGVAMGSSRSKGRSFAEEFALDFPIFDDSNALISRRLGLQSPLVLLGIDTEGYLSLGMGSFETEAPDAVALVENRLREHLRLPEAGAAPSGELERRPMAPLFEAQRMGGGEPFRLADLSGRPVVLIFFLHTCPHCHLALRFFKEQLEQIPEEVRPALVGVSMQNQVTSVRAVLRDEKLDFFPVLLDSDRKIRSAYGVFAGVPDTMLIDAEGRILHRVQGWREQRDPALVRMYLAQMAKIQVPMLLNPKGFTGNDVCAVCHPAETATWEFTSHSVAFNTLVTHGVDRRAECVGCHVVGFEKPGGYSLSDREAHLENVGCETCHGPGGGHLEPKPEDPAERPPIDYQPFCDQCHDPTHSFGFEYGSFLTKISHKAIEELTPGARESLLAGRGQPRDLLPKTSNIVGSEACKSCHEPEYATWAASPHARSVESLRKERKEANADCLLCHVTGFGRPGGFPEEAPVEGQPDLARVGCESCHGPGEEHIKENAKRFGDIVSLGDKCDSCVILQICGTCHDDANDPGFRFSVVERIEAQRHGTTEAGTGKPLGASARVGGDADANLADAPSPLEERG